MTAFEEIVVVAEYLRRAHQLPRRRAVRAAGRGWLRARGRSDQRVNETRGARPAGISAGISASTPRRTADPGVLELASYQAGRSRQHREGTPFNFRHNWIPLNVATALLHRKRRAAARLHADGAPFADDAPNLRTVGGGLLARGPADMTDDDLDGAMQDAIIREDFGYLDRLGDETDRRDTARAKAQRRADTDRIRRQQRADAMLDRMGALIDEGVDEAEAYGEVYGRSPDEFRRKEAIRVLREQGYDGKGFDALARASFREHLSQAFYQAEDDTRGTMLNRKTESANATASARRGKTIDPQDLFEGNEATARRYASDELRAWWDANGRPTFPEWKAQLLNDPAAARALRARRNAMSA